MISEIEASETRRAKVGPMSDRPLTARQRAILVFIVEQIEERGFPPTIREIGAAFKISSTYGVNDHLKALERKGSIARPTGSAARAITITPKGSLEAGVKPKSRTVEVPVQSGPEVPSRVERVLEFDSKLASKGLFGWVAQADSPSDGVFAGDLVLVRPGPVEPGQLALVTSEGRSLLQRLGSGPEPANVHGSVAGVWRTIKLREDD